MVGSKLMSQPASLRTYSPDGSSFTLSSANILLSLDAAMAPAPAVRVPDCLKAYCRPRTALHGVRKRPVWPRRLPSTRENEYLIALMRRTESGGSGRRGLLQGGQAGGSAVQR